MPSSCPVLLPLFLPLFLPFSLFLPVSLSLSPSSLSSLRLESLSMLHHAYDSYLLHAFPLDELNPMTCQGRGRDRSDPLNININDVLGDFSLTLIDSLDTLAVVGNKTEFHRAVRLVIEHVSLVSVFEVTIRVLGSLLSAHLILTQPTLLGDYSLTGYQNELLHLAEDLGRRLLPAFENTATGLPFPRVVLNQGVPWSVINETCTAGAGTLLLEFGLLSRLVGDNRYENVARRAIKGLWSRRSQKDLVGNVINIQTGSWMQMESGIGAGIDSFFEYLLKASIIFDDDEYLEMFQSSYQAIQTYMKDSSTGIYRNVHMNTGSTYTTWIDSLSAYFPGLQVLYGDLQGAIFNHEVHFSIWRRYGMLPERYDIQRKSVNIALYPLRPELVESTYFLYQATKDPYYLEVGARILRDLQAHTRLPCGFATIHNVHLRNHEDRMESFFIAETLKYLYLLFDPDHPLNKNDTPFVFSTEGHLVFLPKHTRKPQQPKRRRPPAPPPASSSSSSRVCAASFLTPRSLSHLHLEFERIRQEIGYQPKPETQPEESSHCLPEEAPTPVAHQVRIDPSSSKPKASFHLSGNQLYFPSLAGYNLELHEMGAEILRIVKIDDVVVRPGTQVNLLESAFLQDASQALGEFATVRITGAEGEAPEDYEDQEYMARPSLYGAHSTVPAAGIQGQAFLLPGLACAPLSRQEAAAARGKIVLVDRGDCLFDAKINHCKDAGAIGVIVLNFEEAAFEMVVGPEVRANPGSGRSKAPEEESAPLPAVLVAQSVAEVLRDLANTQPEAVISVRPDYLGEKMATSRGELLLNFNGRPVDNARILRRFPAQIQALLSS